LVSNLAMRRPELSHCALLYRNDDEFFHAVLEFIAPGLAGGEPVVVALDPDKLDALAERLGDDTRGVRLVDMRWLGRNPARLIPAYRRIHAEHGGGAIHFVGEPVWPGRAVEEVSEALVHEALMNLAFQGRPVRALCPYDARRLEPEVLAAARRTHPQLVARDGLVTCVDYHHDALPQACRQKLAAAPSDSACLEFGISDLGRVRALVSDTSARAGLTVHRREDLVIAVNELATNSVRHGGGTGRLRTWIAPDRVVCEVSDAGVIPDPLAGRTPPEPDGVGGRGLWLVHQLADLAQVRSGHDGTTVRVHAAVAPSDPERGELPDRQLV
jgi:anti-sigma regulatory factor (Ser/Thr protein kinase)